MPWKIAAPRMSARPRHLFGRGQAFGARSQGQLQKGLLAAELNGTVKITYDPKGVVCEVDANLLSEC